MKVDSYGLAEFNEAVIVWLDENHTVECNNFREYIDAVCDFHWTEYAQIPKDTQDYMTGLVNAGIAIKDLANIHSEWKFDDRGYQYIAFPDMQIVLEQLKERHPENAEIYEQVYQEVQHDEEMAEEMHESEMMMGGM